MRDTTALIVEDNQTMREGMAHVLQKMQFHVLLADSGEQGVELAEKHSPAIVVCDYKLPGISGMDVLFQIKDMPHDSEVLMITAYGTIELAVAAIKTGAYDFITKPFSMDEFKIKIEKMAAYFAQRQQALQLGEEVTYLREEIDDQFNFGEIIGDSAAMKKIFATIGKVAPTDTSIIIYGESGTGKELVARAIHLSSQRNTRPLVKVNCGALNENLLESELFGHEKGAFTGALKQKKGRFELANKGTIFLDEIGDISANMQLKLLRVLQEKEFERVGGEETLHTDVRVIAATNKNLQEEMEAGRFREDLFYRLHIVPIEMPPLRERKDDIVLLTEHFLHKIGKELGKVNCRLTKEALHQLQHYHWPGNVRELENVIERALVLTETKEISTNVLPFHLDKKISSQQGTDALLAPGVMPLEETLKEVEKTLLQRALQFTHGNKAAAARLLGIKSNTFFYKVDRFGLGSDQKNERFSQ